MTLQELFMKAVNGYAEKFCVRHELEYDPKGWVSDEPGGVLMVGDYYLDFDDIRWDVDNEVDKEEIFRWYDYTMVVAEFGGQTCTFRQWCGGYRPYSDEQINQIQQAHERVRKAKEVLNEMIEKYTDERKF